MLINPVDYTINLDKLFCLIKQTLE